MNLLGDHWIFGRPFVRKMIVVIFVGLMTVIALTLYSVLDSKDAEGVEVTQIREVAIERQSDGEGVEVQSEEGGGFFSESQTWGWLIALVAIVGTIGLGVGFLASRVEE